MNTSHSLLWTEALVSADTFTGWLCQWNAVKSSRILDCTSTVLEPEKVRYTLYPSQVPPDGQIDTTGALKLQQTVSYTVGTRVYHCEKGGEKEEQKVNVV